MGDVLGNPLPPRGGRFISPGHQLTECAFDCCTQRLPGDSLGGAHKILVQFDRGPLNCHSVHIPIDYVHIRWRSVSLGPPWGTFAGFPAAGQ